MNARTSRRDLLEVFCQNDRKKGGIFIVISTCENIRENLKFKNEIKKGKTVFEKNTKTALTFSLKSEWKD